jgi:GT2 family glycosyltransferase
LPATGAEAMSEQPRHPRLCIAIASFRSDEAALRLAEQAQALAPSFPGMHTLIVDSLGGGAIERAIDERGWRDSVTYVNSASNLGSAGNLASRLEWAAQHGFDYCYGVNHDGNLSADVLAKLIAFAESRARVGAVYPLRYRTGRRGYDLTGTRKAPLPALVRKKVPLQSTVPVSWCSSNGALYALAPVREGVVPYRDFWMGWEDLAYGWQLEAANYEQFILTSATIDDNYEYRPVRFLGRTLHITDKPEWYAYYQGRNLLLSSWRCRRPAQDKLVVGARLLQEVAVTTLFRTKKLRRLQLLGLGVKDALAGRTGKGPVP